MIPLPILTGLISYAVGVIAKLFMMRMQMKHEEQRALMEKAGLVEQARKHGKKDDHFAFTRRIIALSLTAAVLGPMWMPFVGDLLSIQIAVAIPEVDETKTKLLFGLFSYQDTTTTYRHITTATWLPQFDYYFTSVIGLYMGVRK